MQALRATNRAAVRRRSSPLLRAAALLVALGAAAVLLTLPAPPAVANDTSVGGVGGLVYPLENTDIRMQAETVQAVCYRSFAEYRVDFEFVNDGEAQTVKLGFPFEVTVLDEMGSPPVAFRAWQDGKPLTVTLGRGVSWEQLPSDHVGYYLHQATFPHGETMITVSYLAVPTVSAGSRSDAPFTIAGERVNGWQAWYEYWVHTGAGWKATIDKTVVRFTLADDFGGWGVEDQLGDWETTKPGSYVKVGERAYQWVYENYEPTENDDVRLNYTRLNLAYPWVTAIEGIPASFGPMPMKGGDLSPRGGRRTRLSRRLGGGRLRHRDLLGDPVRRQRQRLQGRHRRQPQRARAAHRTRPARHSDLIRRVRPPQGDAGDPLRRHQQGAQAQGRSVASALRHLRQSRMGEVRGA